MLEAKIKQLTSILIKPAGPDCNMACTYCFYLKKSRLFPSTKPRRMSETILKQVVRQVLAAGMEQVSFGWQGGEPTLMGLPFFKKAVDFQQQFGTGQTVGNGLQTNGILIDREWARFLAKYRFLVGLSLDGPRHIHDKYRSLRGGKPSWSKVSDRAKLMLDSGVEVNALSVIDDYSVRFPEELYEYYKSIGLNYMQFIPCVEPDPANPGQKAPYSVDPEGFGKFLIKIFDLWLEDFKDGVPTTFVRFFDSVFFHYVDMPAPDCALQEECGIYVVVEHNGDVFSCDFFVDDEWKLGNVLHDNLADMLNSPTQDRFGKRKIKLAEPCGNCPWLKYCRGGCPKDDRYLCISHKMFFEHADKHYQKLAKNWRPPF